MASLPEGTIPQKQLEEVLDLLSREVRLCNRRGLDTKNLTGLRKRIARSLLGILRNPKVNPEIEAHFNRFFKIVSA